MCPLGDDGHLDANDKRNPLKLTHAVSARHESMEAIVAGARAFPVGMPAGCKTTPASSTLTPRSERKTSNVVVRHASFVKSTLSSKAAAVCADAFHRLCEAHEFTYAEKCVNGLNIMYFTLILTNGTVSLSSAAVCICLLYCGRRVGRCIWH
jgi:hypothetical protein